jgi:hypothetical protein
MAGLSVNPVFPVSIFFLLSMKPNSRDIDSLLSIYYGRIKR